MLFSYRKGLFTYTPLWFFSLLGLIFIFRKQKQAAIYWLVMFLIVTYVLSCWHQWYYGGSFGSRVFVEYYALLIVPFSILLESLKKKPARTIMISIMAILTIFSIIQTYQYYAGIIHWSDMNKEMYWKSILDL
jgi:hypothetical protein